MTRFEQMELVNKFKRLPGLGGQEGQNILDAQLHISIEQDVGFLIAAMDSLGIRSALLDELWGFDENGIPQPHVILRNGSYRPQSALALAASLQYPDRFSFMQRVNRLDPQLAELLAILASTPSCRAIRITLLNDDERNRFTTGDWDNVLQLAQLHEFPVCIYTRDAGDFVSYVAKKYVGLQFVVDHCGLPRNFEQWQLVLGLARFPNVWLKWSHASRSFRRFSDSSESQNREFLRAVGAFGPDRVLWASDASHEESDATWPELLAFVQDNAFLSPSDRDWVLGGSARRLFRWKAQCSKGNQ